ncbi:PucR family transcriptional regulator [Nocardioides cavernaquae]|uniref:PucR family transcriptional regulator n=1 Tax=Nocardioides cavernaquae TaxID=2321396 RepID=A0A3A5HFE1_9ACTN|nr:helix-turn-helix domain-containing protein [Nocardioides cavernaquae]RJS46690.1 hypothetical protein D4739_10990 [Nocardioides cavernaquae]
MNDKEQALLPLVKAFVTAESRPEALERWVERIAAPVLAALPELAEDTTLTESLYAAVRAHWQAFLTSLSEPEREVHLVQAAADFAAELARRGHPLTAMFGIYRTAQQAVWEFLTSVVGTVATPGASDTDFVIFFWSRASSWINASIEESAEIFQEERDRVRQGAAAQRLVAVRSILAGGGSDPRELSAALGGHPLSAYNTALLLRTDDADRVSELREAVTVLARVTQSRNPLLVSPGGRDLWCWFTNRSAPDLHALSDSVDWLQERGISVAVGTPLVGVEGFRLSHQEAQQAQKIAFRSVATPTLTLFSDVELLSLLWSSGEAAQRFATRTLGALADEAEGPTRLRQTLHALLSTGSVDAASRLLSVHKNTVRYRVNQAEALLAQPLGYVPAEVALAIRYYDTFMARPS